MNPSRLRRFAVVLVPGAFLLQLGGCLGPNPGFFLATAAANATIMNLVQRVLNGVLGA